MTNFRKKKYSNTKRQENPSSGSRVPQGWTDMTRLIVAFHSFANAPKMQTDPRPL